MNFIFFYPDEMRADALACYGNKITKTPNLDAFAAGGTQFAHCFVQNPVCSPSRCSLVTGLYPHNRGHRSLWHLLNRDEENMFAYLRDAGYHLQWFGKNDMFSAEAFDSLIHDGCGCSRLAGGCGEQSAPGTPHRNSFLYDAVEEEERISDRILTDRAVEFLNGRKNNEEPFFLFMPLEYPHPPYTAPEEYYHMYNPADMELIDRDGYQKAEFMGWIQKYRGLDALSDTELQKIRAVYLGMCSYTDDLFGKILKAVADNGLTENTAIIVASDHGDWAGDYGVVEKWPNGFDDCLIHVPLIIQIPGGVKGHKVNAPVELFDIMPTVLELAGIPCRHTHFAKSLVPQLYGADGDTNRAVYCEGGYNENEMHCFEGRKENGSEFLMNTDNVYRPKIMQQNEKPQTACKSAMIRMGKHKLVWRSSGQHELYDLENDCYELQNIYGQAKYSSIATELMEKLLTWYIDTADTVPFAPDPRNVPKRFQRGEKG